MMEKPNTYTMAVNNVAAYIKSNENQCALARDDGTAMTAFDASCILGVAFCKSKEDVIVDLIRCK